MTRLAVLLLLVCGSATGCDIGSQGAVGFRWRIVEKDSGRLYDPANQASGDGQGACECVKDNPSCAACPWRIEGVRLLVQDPVSLATADLDDVDVRFPCRVREATTRFTIPEGRWALSLAPFNQGSTPAPDVREVRRGQITNLDVLEIAVCPLPRN